MFTVSSCISLRRRANARNVSTSFLPYGGITYFINSFDYPYLLCFLVIVERKNRSVIIFSLSLNRFGTVSSLLLERIFHK